MEGRAGRPAGSETRSISAGDSLVLEGETPREGDAISVDALDPSALPRVPAGAPDSSPEIASRHSALRADEPGDGGGGYDENPSGDSSTEAEPGTASSNDSGGSRRPTASQVSQPVAAVGPAPRDSDADGLSDAQESQLGTDPSRADTDDDGLTDFVEWAIGSDPTDRDTDDDGLTDARELEIGSNPRDPDTDNDGLGDSNDRDPLRASDSDLDGIPDYVERRAGLDPDHWDTDRDGLADGDEVYVFGTDPRNADSDGDGVGDFQEVADAYAARQRDSDGDGLTDIREAEGRTLRRPTPMETASPTDRKSAPAASGTGPGSRARGPIH